MNPDWLYRSRLGGAFGAGKADIGDCVALEAVVAEHVVAADGMGHCGPLPADGALGAVSLLRTLRSPQVTQRGQQSVDTGLQLPQVYERQQEDEELGKAVPQQLPVQELEVDVSWALGSTEDRLNSQQPFGKGRKGSSLEE